MKIFQSAFDFLEGGTVVVFYEELVAVVLPINDELLSVIEVHAPDWCEFFGKTIDKDGGYGSGEKK